MIWHFCLHFSVLSLFCTLSTLMTMGHKEVLFWPCSFEVLKCPLVLCLFSPSFWRHSATISLNRFSVPSFQSLVSLVHHRFTSFISELYPRSIKPYCHNFKCTNYPTLSLGFSLLFFFIISFSRRPLLIISICFFPLNLFSFFYFEDYRSFSVFGEYFVYIVEFPT